MDQAIQATTPTASTASTASTEAEPQAGQRAAYKRAAALATRVVDQLTRMPRNVDLHSEWDGSYRVILWFGTGLAAGREVTAFADRTGTCPTRSQGIYVECAATVEGVQLTARALLTTAEADQLLQQNPPAPATPAAQPVPLSAAHLAHGSAVASVQPVTTEHRDQEETARCHRCGCTDDNACEGGCYWVSNAQMVDLCSACATVKELQAAAYTATGTEAADGRQ